MNLETEFDPEVGELLMIHKPLTWTSFDIVRKIRNTTTRALGRKKLKVGHAGTLDPLAEGLLIVCMGKQTKKIDSYQAQLKEYIATAIIGATRPSYDRETEIDKTFETDLITCEQVQTVIDSFVGEQIQYPPIFSAKKIDGKRAYESARKGIEVKMKPNLITIHEIELLSCEMPEIKFRVTCSKGTYIRSLAHDIGKALDNGAYLSHLLRTKIGDYNVEQAISIDEYIERLNKMTTKESENKENI